MRFIRQHWFGIITGTVIFCFLVMFILVLISPRQDVRKRGFIPCTEAMAEQMLSCSENKLGCMFKAVLKNSWCDLNVIGRGFVLWAKGDQDWPWSNYIFIPELPQDEFFDKEAQAEYFKNNPGTVAEMQQLKELNEQLENDNEQIRVTPEDQPR